MLKRRAAIAFCAATLERFAIHAPGPATLATALSGGNRQRLTVARALASAPAAIVAHDVSRGLDLRATAEVHRRLRDYAAAGGAVLLISSELDELFELCIRIHVLSRGRLIEVSPADRNPERLGLLMSGAAA
jgi:simple sugar transport system ATP-binding protein